MEKNRKEARRQYAERQEKKFGRLAKYSVDSGNQQRYDAKKEEWTHVRFRTGDIDTIEYLNQKKRCKFLGAPEDITSVWTLNGEKEKRQIDLFRFTHLTFIDEIGLYKDKQIIGIYKRNKKNKSRSSVQSLWIMGTVNNSYLLVFYNNICECAIFLIIAPAQIILYCLVIYLLPCRFF